MRINIKNVGIIQDSTLDIGGLTVITGQNNSGKTTVGKVLYSLFSSKENLFQNATNDIIKFAKGRISDIIRNSDLSFFFRSYKFRKISDQSDENILYNAYKDLHPYLNSIEDVVDYILSICEEIKQLNLVDLSADIKDVKHALSKYKNQEDFDVEMSKIVEEFSKLVKKINGLCDFSFYERTKIYKTLQKEFNGQISPVRLPEEYMSIVSLSNENDRFEVRVDNDAKKIATDGYFGFEEIGSVIFIDDITVLDSALPNFKDRYRYARVYRGNELSDVISTLDHKISLLFKLSSSQNIVESMVDNNTIEQLEEQLSSVLADDIVLRDGEFVCSKDNLNLANLAMGSKLFAMLKMLISNGCINDKTLIILDEPEAHLHPLWQNKLAEIVVFIVKKLNAKIVITSHSPNFVLALQTYVMKYKLTNNCNFYTTEKREDGYMVDYKLMNDDLARIYADFATPFSQIKALFDSIKLGENHG